MRIISVTLLTICVLSQAASADGIWSMNGASCTPSETWIQANSYITSAGSIKLNGPAFSCNPCTLYCPVALNSNTNLNSIGLTAFMDTGTFNTTTEHATAQLISMDRYGGTITSVGPPVQSVAGSAGGHFTVPYTLGLYNYTVAYYIRIDIYDRSRAQNIIVYGVDLTY